MVAQFRHTNMTKMSESCDELELGCYELKLVKKGLDWTRKSWTHQILMTNLNFCQPVALKGYRPVFPKRTKWSEDPYGPGLIQ